MLDKCKFLGSFFKTTSKISKKKTAVKTLTSDISSDVSKPSQPKITNYLTELPIPSTSGIEKRLRKVKKAEVHMPERKSFRLGFR